VTTPEARKRRDRDQTPPEVAPASNAEGASAGRARLILIVEDGPNVRLIFSTALVSNEHSVAVAEDGETALRWLASRPFDLVLLDLRMPGIDGLEVLRRLRATGNNVPVVIVSAHDSTPNVVQTIRLGAFDFLPKPTTPADLRRVVADVLARHADQPGRTKPKSPAGATTSPAKDAVTRAKRNLNRREFDHADTALKEALEKDSRCAEAHYLKGVLHELRGERDSAYRAYRTAVNADAAYEPARLHLMKYFDDRLM
jgi:DNA-binding response OmpR family regulator